MHLDQYCQKMMQEISFFLYLLDLSIQEPLKIALIQYHLLLVFLLIIKFFIFDLGLKFLEILPFLNTFIQEYNQQTTYLQIQYNMMILIKFKVLYTILQRHILSLQLHLILIFKKQWILLTQNQLIQLSSLNLIKYSKVLNLDE